MNETRQKIQNYHLIAVVFFIIAALIRLSAIHNLSLTEQEAVFLLSLTSPRDYLPSSFLYQMIIKPVLFFFGDSYLAARIINVLLGSTLVVFPIFFEKELGKKTTLLMSFFLMVDPFLIANSALLVSHNLILLLLGIFLLAIALNNDNAIVLALLLIILSGFGLGYLILVIFIISIINSLMKRSLFNYECLKKVVNRILGCSQGRLILVSALSATLIIAFVFKIDMTSIIQDLLSFITDWSNAYMMENRPLVYLLVLLAYIPLGIVVVTLSLRTNFSSSKRTVNFLLVWIMISIMIISLFPGHHFIDLAWVSMPIWIIVSIYLGGLDFYPLLKNSTGKLGIITLLVISTSIILTIISLINRVGNQERVVDELLVVIVLIAVLIMILVFIGLQVSLKESYRAFLICVLVLGLLFQLSNAMRAAGINLQPEYEVLWNGYFNDEEYVKQLIDEQRSQKLGTSGILNIAIIDFQSPQTEWIFHQKNVNYKNNMYQTEMDWHAVMTDSNQITNKDGEFFGQRIVKKSYPLWMHEPINALRYEFWAWMFFRQARLFYEYGYFWSKNVT